MSRISALSLALLSAATLSCDRATAPVVTGAIDVALTTEALHAVRITATSTNGSKSVTTSVIDGQHTRVVLDELLAGSYDVTVEGLVDGQVAQFGTTSGVSVTGGRTTSPLVSLSLFQPIVTNFTIADTVRVLHFTVEYAPVAHATSYIIDWSRSHTFETVTSDTVTGASADIVVPDEGTYYFTVRAANPVVTAGGLPSPMKSVHALQAVATVTVLPATPSIVDGTTQQFTAVARDADNTVLSGITFFWASSNNAVATVSQTGLVTSVSHGQATISAVGKGVPGNATITVTPQAATKLVFTSEPTTSAAGQSIPSIKVAIQNAKNQTLTTDNTTQVTLAITNPAGATLAGTATATVANGVATFGNLSINRTGANYTFTATATSLASATSAQFNITPAAASQLAFSVPPATTTAGAPFAAAVQVEIRDALGNRVTTARDAITLAIGANPGSGTLSGTLVVNAIDGVASFDGLSINKVANAYTLTANGASLPQVTSAAFNITSIGIATTLAFDVQPANTSADNTMSVTVSARDGFGNLVAAAVPVTVAIFANPAAGTLSGTTQLTTSAGTATFGNLNIDKAGAGYRLVATSGGLSQVVSNAITISAGVPSVLAFVTPPTGAEPQGPLGTVTVAVRDAHGNQTAAAMNVDIGMSNNPGSGTLTGTTTVMSVSGLATFNDLSIDNAGDGYELFATGAGVADGFSEPFDVFLKFSSAYAGEGYSCGVTVRGSAYCWGANDGSGRLGNGVDDGSFNTPQRVAGGHQFLSLTLGFVHVCGVRSTDRAALCWGSGGSGRLGNGVLSGTFNTPQLVADGHTFHSVSAAEAHTCGIRATDNAGLCWGHGGNGRLGNGGTINASTPQLVSDGHAFISITAGLSQSCAVRTDRTAYCWGSAASGRLGNNVFAGDFSTPQAVQGGFLFTSISSRTDHTCAVRSTDSRAMCWGASGSGRLGNGTTTPDIALPAEVLNGIRYSRLSAGYEHSCGLGLNGTVFCWGNGGSGSLGNGSLGTSSTPVAVVGGLMFTFMSIDATFPGQTCGVATTGAYCWGRNNSGELGDGTQLQSSVPVRVKGSR